MSIFDAIVNPPDKNAWKSMTEGAINTYWSQYVISEAADKSSMKYININNLQVGRTHQVWSTLSTNPRDTTLAGVKARLLTNTYTLQSNRAKFNQYSVDETCPLCGEEPEDRCHFILKCQKLDVPRSYYLDHLRKLLYDICSHDEANAIMVNQQLILQLILDCSHPAVVSVINLTPHLIERIERISRKLCFTLHRHRCAQMNALNNDAN